MKKETIKFSLHLSPATDQLLETLSSDNHMTKSELLRKALALMYIALREKEKGNHLGVISHDQKIITEIVGL